MPQLGSSYFVSVPEKKESIRTDCILYIGPSNNFIRNQDTFSIVIKKLVSALDKHEIRLLKGRL